MLESDDSVIHGNNGKPKQAAAAGRASLKAQAYEEIHRRINTLQFRPGDFLNEAYIAEMLELGRTPVREALSQLKHEGIVEIAPRKGIIIRPVSLNDVLEIIEVRLINEVHCAGLAAGRATETEISHMNSILQRTEAAIEPCAHESSMNLDREFPAAIATRRPGLHLTRSLFGALSETPYRFNPQRARQLLEEAGYGGGFAIPMAARHGVFTSLG